MTLTLSLSPAFQLSRDGEPVALKNKKAQALLVYLALTKQPQTREHLATLLWGDRFDEQARKSLRQALFALRKAAGDGVIVGDDPLVLAEGGLSVEDKGDLLPGFQTGADDFDTWLGRTRTEFSESQAEQLMIEAERLKDTGDTREALRLAERVSALQPLSEPGLRLTMTLLAAEGRRGDALALFQLFEEKMKSELDAEPDTLSRNVFNLLKQNDTESFKVDAPAEPFETNKYLVADFEDLGGGDIATFIARELPIQIIADLNRAGYADAVQFTPIDIGGAASQADLSSRIRDAGAAVLISGSTRQIGDRIRVSFRGHSQDNDLLFNESTVITADEAFDFIPSATDRLRNGLLTHFRRTRRSASTPLEKLKPITSEPEKFRAMFTDLWMGSFYGTHSRASQAEMGEACDYALDEFPGTAVYLVAKGMVTHHIAQLADTRDRVAGFRAAGDYLKRARALEPGLYTALHISMIPANWLGQFDEVKDWYRTLSQPGVRVGSLDGLLALSHLFSGEYDAAIEEMHSTIEQETGYPVLMYRYGGLGLALFLKEEYQQALEAAENGLVISGEFWLPHLIAIAALQRLGQTQEAHGALQNMRAFYHAPKVSDWDWLPFTDPVPKSSFLNALRDAGMPE